MLAPKLAQDGCGNVQLSLSWPPSVCFSRLDSPKSTYVGLAPRSALLLVHNCLCKPLLAQYDQFSVRIYLATV